MHTSTHAAPLIKHAVIGVGGWHCYCCAPRGANKYAARARAMLRRQAKKRERAAFMREQHNLLVADFQSIFIEMRMDDAEQFGPFGDAWELEEEAQRTKYNERMQRYDRYLGRLGNGAKIWEPQTSRPFAPSLEQWALIDVYRRDYDDPDFYVYDSRDYEPAFGATVIATVDIDRANLQWVVRLPMTDLVMALPYMEHSLEEMQQLAQMLLRLQLNEENYQ